MADRKIQHFVPQFLLRRFSPEPRGAFVALYNIKRDTVVRKAPIRAQAARNYLYGSDGNVEQVLSEIEGRAAAIIAHVASTRTAPAIGTFEHQMLLLFANVQAARSPAAGAELRAANEAREAARVEMHRRHGQIVEAEPLDDRPEVTAIQGALRLSEATHDLACTVIENEAEVEFALSDLGVTLHNQWRQESGQAHVAAGSAGLQIFLPISPRLLVAFYDGTAYVVRKGKSERNPRITTNAEVGEFNLLVMEEAHENIYFTGDERTAQQISWKVTRAAPRHEASAQTSFQAGDDHALVVLFRRPSPARLTDRVFIVDSRLPPSHRDLNAILRPFARTTYERLPAHIEGGAGGFRLTWDATLRRRKSR